MLVWWVYDLIDAKLMLNLNSETSFFLQLPSGRISDTFKSVDLPPRENPIAPLRILIAFSQQNSIGLVSNDKRRANSGKSLTHSSQSFGLSLQATPASLFAGRTTT